jgi:HSP20 family protein
MSDDVMNLSDWDIFGEMTRIGDELRSLAAGVRTANPARSRDEPWAPPVDIYDLDDAVVMVVDLPGVRREDIELEVNSDSLTLRGRRPSEERSRSLRIERPSGPFQRSFHIGGAIDSAGAQAEYREGVLRITMPKRKPAGPTRVRVAVE